MNDLFNEKRSWLKTHRSFLKNTLKIGAIIGVWATIIIPVNVWPFKLSKFAIVIVCGIIYLALTLINYYRPFNTY
ncbi:hypothetical protein Desaci_4317 [Desulfosporosinus acidiphilus SJ4]|uniref:Uncharacterized protein n=1 Tax=Desulfosporosinus acidiphilus (strain DSM 22704 / JCM 16185 / SJ4) TaxID=646529 RepID=I4DBJ3_DESAJ|nr:hypothetical protein Desaci_4317 [Desulfosporosinus acidiphilus SJ4]